MSAVTLGTRPIAPEDQARANYYALISAFFRSAPSAELLAAVAASPTDEIHSQLEPLPRAWRSLVIACQAMDVEAAAGEFATLFESVGKPEVALNGSFHETGFFHEKPLAALREDLQALGLSRAEHEVETEDHIANLCEVMRYLIVRLDRSENERLEVQRRMFQRHIAPWHERLWNDIDKHKDANFFRCVAAFAKAFFLVECEHFNLQR